MRILVCEDETIIRLDLCGLLERHDFEVCGQARDGEEAIDLARSLEPDLLVMDVKMPKLDGVEAARRINAERPVPIVLLTAYSDRHLVTRAVDAGISGYLVKPFREQELLPAIETAAARHQDLLSARRELGQKPPKEPPLDLTVMSNSGHRWPLRIERTPTGDINVSMLTDD